MKSNVDYWLKRIDATVDVRLEASGTLISNAIKADITRQGLIVSARMVGDVRPVMRGKEVRVGTTLDDPNYPFFLNGGFIHHLSGELVGPFRFMENGLENAEEGLRGVWQRPIGRGR